MKRSDSVGACLCPPPNDYMPGHWTLVDHDLLQESFIQQYLTLSSIPHLLSQYLPLKGVQETVVRLARPDETWLTYKDYLKTEAGRRSVQPFMWLAAPLPKSIFPHSLFDRDAGFCVLSREVILIRLESLRGYFSYATLDDVLPYMNNAYVTITEVRRFRLLWERRHRTALGLAYEQ